MEEKYNVETNAIYYLVDEHFLEGYNKNQKKLMKNIYYKVYLDSCKKRNLIAKDFNSFFKNMRRNKLKLIQAICPYCRKIWIIDETTTLSKIKSIKFCSFCGKGTLYNNTMIQLNRIMRIIGQNSYTYSKLRKDDPEHDRLISYDMHQFEIITITSFMENILREYFNIFTFIKYGVLIDDYFCKVLSRNVKNDFMNIQKANDHYKQAFNINLKKLSQADDWENINDLVTLRNAFVHNNGFLDKKFKTTKTYVKYSNNIVGDFIFLKKKDIYKLASSVVNIVSIIEDEFIQRKDKELHKIISTYYLNEVSYSKMK